MQSGIPIHLIDDDNLVRSVISNMLQASGFEVIEYVSAIQFLADHDASGLGCVITDVNMPGMTGVELVRRLRAEGIGHPVIVMSGAAEIDLAVAAMRAGAIDFLAKPFGAAALVEKVRAVLEGGDLQLMSEMLAAIEAGEVEVHYQPKLHLETGEIRAAEALVRWGHPTRGPIAPDQFIPVAERTGYIGALTEFVLKRVVEDQATLASLGIQIECAVNISGRTLGDPEFAEFAIATVAGAAGKVCFEITETAAIEQLEAASSMLSQLAQAGIGVAIDDFGAGLSSLGYLREIPANELKIDKSIIRDLTCQPRAAHIAEAAVRLAHSLGMTATVEGVETEEALIMLARMGCDEAQGYLIARPGPLESLIAIHRDPKRLGHIRRALGLAPPTCSAPPQAKAA